MINIIGFILIASGSLISVLSQFAYTVKDVIDHAFGLANDSNRPYIGTPEYTKAIKKRKIAYYGAFIGGVMMLTGLILTWM